MLITRPVTPSAYDIDMFDQVYNILSDFFPPLHWISPKRKHQYDCSFHISSSFLMVVSTPKFSKVPIFFSPSDIP